MTIERNMKWGSNILILYLFCSIQLLNKLKVSILCFLMFLYLFKISIRFLISCYIVLAIQTKPQFLFKTHQVLSLLCIIYNSFSHYRESSMYTPWNAIEQINFSIYIKFTTRNWLSIQNIQNLNEYLDSAHIMQYE